MKYQPIKPACEDPPKRITDDQYDKLMRRVWELEQQVKSYKEQTLNAVNLDAVFDRQFKIEEEIKALKRKTNRWLNILEGLVSLLVKSKNSV